ncbi:hypothetical protein G3A43_07795 [Paraburkholderia aspalathi]|nr:hypothetical protein [Paraburkholderia aspalathi]MBK3780158.1 hypothetical protein [Paraburkholderia aspalathi]
MTNWEKIRERRNDYQLTAPDETGPARILEAFAALGISGAEKEGLVLLTNPPLPDSVIAFVSATELFAWDEEQDARIARRRTSRLVGTTDMFAEKLAMWREAHPKLAGPNAYLYVVDLDRWLDSLDHQDVARLLAHDTRGIRKFVCRPEELAALLANPFGATYTGSRIPEVDAQRMDVHSFEPTPRDFAATVTHPFVRVADPSSWYEKLQRHPDASRLTALANVLARRVMGTDYRLVEGVDEVMIDRFGRCSAMPWFCLGMGEQYGLAFCVYLALAADEASPDTWLGITDVLTYLDLSHYLLAIDTLQSFVLATGTNVYIKTNKKEYLDLARGKLEAAVACLKE